MNSNNVTKFVGVIVLLAVVGFGAYFIGKNAGVSDQNATVLRAINSNPPTPTSLISKGTAKAPEYMAWYYPDGTCNYVNSAGQSISSTGTTEHNSAGDVYCKIVISSAPSAGSQQ